MFANNSLWIFTFHCYMKNITGPVNILQCPMGENCHMANKFDCCPTNDWNSIDANLSMCKLFTVTKVVQPSTCDLDSLSNQN